MATTIIEVEGDADSGNIPADHHTPLGELLVAWAARYSSLPVNELTMVDVDGGRLLDPADTVIEAGLSFGNLIRLLPIADAAELLGAVDLLSVAIPVSSRSRPEVREVTDVASRAWMPAPPIRVLPPPPPDPPAGLYPHLEGMPPVPSRPPRAS